VVLCRRFTMRLRRSLWLRGPKELSYFIVSEIGMSLRIRLLPSVVTHGFGATTQGGPSPCSVCDVERTLGAPDQRSWVVLGRGGTRGSWRRRTQLG
jgi:hypothetical protein